MMPLMQAEEWLTRGELVSIAPGQVLEVPLYWHFWRHSGELIERLTAALDRVQLR
ncbi:MAG: hypothetical protein IBX53_02415 [Halomonas sp.]|uniref:hypothetical protein n=1 Tax=Halomonas sp. TaxID=1486246 RepID=UPI0019FC4D5F|nr:hypothetical protein [Halomonas sp.]MBE0487907.1 hypothetical protein [Halomonas sp.]